MKIAVIGAGNVGGGLARLWEQAGHDVTTIGREGGDASDADAVLLSVPSDEIGNALGNVSGLQGKVLVDATNLIKGERPQGFESLAEYTKSESGAQVAKAFNTNFAALYDRIGEAKTKPSCLYCGDDGAKEATAQLISDAGYEPVDAGGLENARALEDFLKTNFAVYGARGAPFFYRIGAPEEL